MKPTNNTKPARILVVDDHPKITRLLRINLEETGDYDVREENRGTHAVSAGREFRPDLVVADVIMPDCMWLRHQPQSPRG
jgi:two-component system, OmpR family, response regulator